jgi:hypothetical protein
MISGKGKYFRDTVIYRPLPSEASRIGAVDKSQEWCYITKFGSFSPEKERPDREKEHQVKASVSHRTLAVFICGEILWQGYFYPEKRTAWGT